MPPLKFQQLADDLRRGLRAGTWSHGERLPTERRLVESTGFSLNTVRRALDVLVAEGMLERRQGSGTFAVGRSDSAGRAGQLVGVLLPDTSLYYPRVLQGVEARLSEHRMGVQLAAYGYDAAREDACIQRLLDRQVSGLLLVPTLSGVPDPIARLEELLQLPVPVVFLERSLPALGPADRSEHVCSDHAAGAYDAVGHLHRLGHQRIALLLRGRSPTGPSVEMGYERAASDLALPSVVLRYPPEDWDPVAAGRALSEILAWGATAALVFGDREATLVLSAARRQGLMVPEDLALVSYDDEFADLADVPLTAVSPAKHRIGRMAAEVLAQRLREGDESPVNQTWIRPRLVIRDSCGARQRWGAASPRQSA